ncbi:MAG: endopeptidase La [Gammaproteobacteria bacterium]|nr:MAG: endopeptidase La [Gammaproteobacteria bacterium]
MSENQEQAKTPLELPIFPLRNSVLYPYALGPFSAGRRISMEAVDAASGSEEKEIAVFAQRDIAVDVPDQDDLYEIGTRAVIKRMARSEETVEMILQGVERIRLVKLEKQDPYLLGRFEALPMPAWEDTPEAEALKQELVALTKQYQGMVQMAMSFDVEQAARQLEGPVQLIYFLAMIPDLPLEKSQQILEADSALEAMKRLHEYLSHEIKVLKLRQEIAGQVQGEMEKQQREHILRQQLRAIQEELGETNPEDQEVAELRRRLEEADLPELVREEAERELNRMQRLNASSPDYQVIRNYLDLVLELPWKAETEDVLDLKRAREVLDEDHYGLEKIKERILEQLAVLKLNPEAKAPILLFVGPPGVGKTSLGKSIARALGRKFERLSLGGLHDESELRGHRRTYVGAMPGRIIQAMRRAQVRNPLLMLDEVDKLGRDFRGDPASALLEILDPNQNSDFRDNYLDLPFDLSHTFFILTANTLDTIPGPLLDRMEVIQLSGYSDEEKLEIAKRYLLERQRKDAGLTSEQFVVPDETLRALIRDYTREAGVRNLERAIGRLARRVALTIAEGGEAPPRITPDMLGEMLGKRLHTPDEARKELPAGVAAGLAWTPTGGDVLYIEAIRLPTGEGLRLTGQLGDVMKESAQAAYSWVIAHAQELGIEDTSGAVHVHVPAGAIPKDGPSAGVTMATAIASLLSGKAARADTAMTGEITLTGLVLPVGGIKEKVLAARRLGFRQVILPRQNEEDLDDLPEDVRKEMHFVLADRIDQVLETAIGNGVSQKS